MGEASFLRESRSAHSDSGQHQRGHRILSQFSDLSIFLNGESGKEEIASCPIQPLPFSLRTKVIMSHVYELHFLCGVYTYL